VDHLGQGRQSELLSQPAGWSPGRVHLRRLRALWRSAGWPCLDATEIDLLAAGLIERVPAPAGTLLGETLRLTDLGLAWLKRSLEANRGALDAHEVLVARVAALRHEEGRVVWTGLSVRAPLEAGLTVPADTYPALENATHAHHVSAATQAQPSVAVGPLPPVADLFGETVTAPTEPTRWRLCRPDVFSVRNTTDPARLASRVDEIKSRRSDLLGDLKRADKRAAYLALADECWYVLGADEAGRPIADPSEVPEDCGVVIEEQRRLRLARPAPRRLPKVPSFSLWMALARATPFDPSLRLGGGEDLAGTNRQSSLAPSPGSSAGIWRGARPDDLG